jgi:formylmethanofuran dehydrogenase subunit E
MTEEKKFHNLQQVKQFEGHYSPYSQLQHMGILMAEMAGRLSSVISAIELAIRRKNSEEGSGK